MNLKRAISAVCAAAVLVSTSLSDLPAQFSAYSHAYAALTAFQYTFDQSPVAMAVQSADDGSLKCEVVTRFPADGVTNGVTTVAELRRLYSGLTVNGFEFSNSSLEGLTAEDIHTSISVLSGTDSNSYDGWYAVTDKDTLDFADMPADKYPITLESILRYSAGSKAIYKCHIMHALMDYGYTTELYGDVYDSIFDVNDGICADEVASEANFYPDVHFVTTLIRASGGISVMAHPKVYDSTALLEELASKHEIDGVEVWHQSADEQYRAQLQDIAAANGLLVTGGSDFHGFYNHYAIQIGSNTTPEESLNRIITHKGKA